jgi:phytoene dehydrogenase-like protein
MTKTPQNITVIGAGINGLVAANYLSRAGHKVTLLERNDRVGGACVSETAEVKEIIHSHVENPEDGIWSRLLTPRDLQQTFGFPGGNIEHTMLVEGQSYFDRQYAEDARRRFYQFGEFENVSICGSSTYPCGSVAGTPGYMCISELLRQMRS